MRKYEGTNTMLIKCNNCGVDYSEYAGCCPKCKAINQNKHELEKNCFDPYYKDTYFSYLNSNKKKAAKPIIEAKEQEEINMDSNVLTACRIIIIIGVICWIFIGLCALGAIRF